MTAGRTLGHDVIGGVPPRRCRLRLLGAFALDRAGEPVVLPAAAQRLLALLALDGPRLARARVAFLLWPDTTEQSAAAQLRRVLWRMNGRAEGLVHSDRATVALGEVDVDVAAVRQTATRLQSGALTGLGQLEPFTAELLPTWEDEWLIVERERLRQVRLHALERASELLLARGDHAAALDAGLLAVSCDELRESAHRCVVRVHLAEGNVSEATRQCRRYLDALTDAALPARLSPAMARLMAE